MKLGALLLVLFMLFPSSSQAKTDWYGLKLTPVPIDEQETLCEKYVEAPVVLLESDEDIRIGDIRAVDIVGDSVMVVVEHYLYDTVQIWLWNVKSGFQFGYEFDCDFRKNNDYALSKNGEVLVYVGRDGHIVGFTRDGNEVKTTVYSTPQQVKKMNYDVIVRSKYTLINETNPGVIISSPYEGHNGRVVVEATNGWRKTVFDFRKQYSQYKKEKYEHLMPHPYIGLFLILFFFGGLFLVLKNVPLPKRYEKKFDRRLPRK